MNGALPRLARLLAEEAGMGRAAVVETRSLGGGAVRAHWLVAVEREDGGREQLVLRTEGATPLGLGLELGDEFALLRLVYGAGLMVPQPILYCADRSLIGSPFHLTRFCDGTSDPASLVAAGEQDRLAEALGRSLGALHRLRLRPGEVAFLGAKPVDAAAARLGQWRGWLDAIGEPRPVAEWAMRLIARALPSPAAPVLCHGDFRTGNYLVRDGALVAVVDWEFAHWGDPDEDVAWFHSRLWRFGAFAREAGGIGPRAAFARGYEAEAGRSLDPARLAFWEAMAALKWLVIALLQRDRFLRAGEPSLDLALTGKRAAECEWELLRLLEEA